MIVTAVTVALVILAGCSNDKPVARRTLSERDSVLAEESLPGAGVVGRALTERDRLEAHASSMNAQVDSLPR